MGKTILLIGTLDTKGDEFQYVKRLIEHQGHRTLVMDTGVMDAPLFPPDISAAQVAEAGGDSLLHLREAQDRGRAMEVMMAGAAELVVELFEKSAFDGVLALGGGGGTTVASAAMRQLPVGVPKVMVSTLASSDVRAYVGVKDITMFHSVVDVAGLNRISMRIFANAVGAICGMVEQVVEMQAGKPLIAASMFGVTTPCVTTVRNRLEREGFEVLVFHATGMGGRAMEGLIDDGYIAGVADVTTTEWCDELFGGVLSAGPGRLDAASRTATPQVVSCGALDMVNFHALETVPEVFAARKLYRHNPTVTLMRTTPDECYQLGRMVGAKVSHTAGKASILVPLRGISAIDAPGQPFYDPEADAALFQGLRDATLPHVRLEELDMHINDPEFGVAIADRLLEYVDIE